MNCVHQLSKGDASIPFANNIEGKVLNTECEVVEHNEEGTKGT